MSQIADWLRRLGLERYATTFRDNDIDLAVLQQLTAEDLRELGVASVGHRRRLLDAIAALDASAPPADGSKLSPPTTATLTSQGDAERRQLTVMFCDLVASTALATRLDPEDLRDVLAGYHRAIADTVGRFDGFVARYMGDGVLVYFGYPRAHEDDAERAVRAGLAAIEAVGRLPVQQGLRVRVGIATGLAVVGDLLGEGAAQERGVVGEPRTSQPGCRRLLRPIRSSLVQRRASRSAGCSSSPISARRRSPALSSHNLRGGSLARAGF